MITLLCWTLSKSDTDGFGEAMNILGADGMRVQIMRLEITEAGEHERTEVQKARAHGKARR